MIAAYHARCMACEGRITPGELITRSHLANGWVHETCPEDRPVGEVCTQCFLVKPCPCEDDQ